MNGENATRIQLCGKLKVELGGRRIEDLLPSRQGRVAFAFLALNRLRPVRRDELADILWADQVPTSANVALRALLSKLRTALGEDLLRGKSELSLALGPDAWVDYEAAHEAIHRADAHIAREEWHEAWWPTRIAHNIAQREFLPGAECEWVQQRRAALDDLRLRTHEAIAKVGLGIGGSELISAKRSARAIIDESPYHESGYCLLMRVLMAMGDVPEAILVYERLRRTLRDELGTSPGPTAQALHRELIGTA